MLLGVVIEYLVLPQIAGVEHSIHLLGQVNVGFVILGAALEVASLAAYAQLTRAVLPTRTSTFSRIWRIDLSTLATSHVLPGGTAGGDGLGYQLLIKEGASGSDAGFALATQGIGSAVVLNVVLWAALVISIPLYGFNAIYATAAGIGAVLIALFAGLILLFTRGQAHATDLLRGASRRIPKLTPERAEQIVADISERIRTMAADPALLRRAILWAAANWLLDAASLFVFLAAFHHIENIDGLLVAYGLAYVLAAIPVTPGGLGVVEAVLVPSLVGFGATRGVAVLGVIGYRLVNFWLPIPVGAGAYLSLRRGSSRGAETVGRSEETVNQNDKVSGRALADLDAAMEQARTARPLLVPGPGSGQPGGTEEATTADAPPGPEPHAFPGTP